MHKEIEIVPVSDIRLLKERLEQMVNEGWEIKGFSCNCNSSYGGSFVVLERNSDRYADRLLESAAEKPLDDMISPPKSDQPDITISMGGN